MLNEIFILIIFIVLVFTYRWAFHALPDEKWQIIGCLPDRKLSNGYWQGWNLTWYGFFIATGMAFAVSIFIILMGALSMPVVHMTLILIFLFLIGLKASRIIAWMTEKKKNTATVGGASFLGIMIAPWILFLAGQAGGSLFNLHISVIAALSAMSIAYAFGEGTGRLACISFGCCYGKPVKDVSPHFQKFFHRYHFIFTGKTKKIAYAHSWDGQKVIPVQAMTAMIYGAAGLTGCYLFLNGFVNMAFILTLTVTQVWRFFSEFLRADYRGSGKISAYQVMALISAFYGLLMGYVFYEDLPHQPDLMQGFLKFWNPAVILLLIALWAFTFFYTGKSKVTASLIDIHVKEEKT